VVVLRLFRVKPRPSIEPTTAPKEA